MKSLYRKALQKEEGFTLIEIMITMVVVVLALCGVLFANTAVQNAHMSAFERSIAVQEAHQVIEQMRNTANTTAGTFPGTVTSAYANNTARSGFTRLTANCGDNATPASSCNWPFSFTSDSTSNEQVVVTYANQSANPLDVTVTVVWKERGVRQESRALRALITKRQ